MVFLDGSDVISWLTLLLVTDKITMKICQDSKLMEPHYKGHRASLVTPYLAMESIGHRMMLKVRKIQKGEATSSC